MNKFNEYSIIWDKKDITIYANDLEIYKIDISSTDLIAFHNTFYLNINLLVGGNTVNNKVDDSAFPIDMVIDYIKIYQYNSKNFNTINSHSITSYQYSSLIESIPIIKTNTILTSINNNIKTTNINIIGDFPITTMIKTNSILTSIINNNKKSTNINNYLKTNLISNIANSSTIINNNFEKITNITIIDSKSIQISSTLKNNIITSSLKTIIIKKNLKTSFSIYSPKSTYFDTISKTNMINTIQKSSIISNYSKSSEIIINNISKTSLNINVNESNIINENSKISNDINDANDYFNLIYSNKLLTLILILLY